MFISLSYNMQHEKVARLRDCYEIQNKCYSIYVIIFIFAIEYGV